MNGWDWLIVGIYIISLLGLSFYLSKGQETTDDYYLAGRSFKWWQVGLSTMATQLGAVSFISAPAFVGIREGGGMQWLTYEFAVPLAMIFLIIVIFPPLYRSGIISIYEYLEQRFGESTRLILSCVFQFSRAFAAGITVYAIGIILSAVFDIPLWVTIIIAGVIALIYDYFGGMKAVVISDVIQMCILSVGIVICGWYALSLLGGWDSFFNTIDPERMQIIDWSNTGLGTNQEFGFLPMVFGGFFLYASYYGCDQSQAQRMLSAQNLKEVRKALVFNSLFRFPLVFLYCTMGLMIGAYVSMNAGFGEQMPAGQPDYMVPLFIIKYLPHGIIGLLIVAIFSAAMSSLDSALNSLSAATVEDLIIRGRAESLSMDQKMRYSKLTTLFWGIVCIVLAFAAGHIAETIIEAINKMGSLFYGPVIATFVLAILTKRTHTTGMNIGIITGVLFNFMLWIFFSETVFWFWWNVSGFLVTLGVAWGYSLLFKHGHTAQIISLDNIKSRPREILVLGSYFLLIILFSSLLMTFH